MILLMPSNKLQHSFNIQDPEEVPFLQVQCAIDEFKPGEGVIITYTVSFLVSKKTEGVSSVSTCKRHFITSSLVKIVDQLYVQ